jgi:hypothetical protein
LAPTLAAAAGLPAKLPGVDLARLAPDAERSRRYGIYVQRKGTPGGHLERVEHYVVEGESRRPAAWRFDEVVFSPAIDLHASFIDAGDPVAAAHFSYLGWVPPAPKRAVAPVAQALGPLATVFVTLPPGAPVEMRTRLGTSLWALPQEVTVEVAGVPVAHWRIDRAEFREYTATIPASAIGEGPVAVHFHSARHQRAGSREPVSAFELDWIRFTPVARP